jgi:hypothetical protein
MSDLLDAYRAALEERERREAAEARRLEPIARADRVKLDRELKARPMTAAEIDALAVSGRALHVASRRREALREAVAAVAGLTTFDAARAALEGQERAEAAEVERLAAMVDKARRESERGDAEFDIFVDAAKSHFLAEIRRDAFRGALALLAEPAAWPMGGSGARPDPRPASRTADQRPASLPTNGPPFAREDLAAAVRLLAAMLARVSDDEADCRAVARRSCHDLRALTDRALETRGFRRMSPPETLPYEERQ